MTALSSNPINQEATITLEAMAEAEQAAVGPIADQLSTLGVPRIAAAEVWVALKSKPMVIFAGPQGSGKEAIALRAAQAVTGGAEAQLQRFQGHPWWANGRDHGLLTRAQGRLTAYRLRLFLEEAARPQHDRSLFFGVFSRISRAELFTVFTPLPWRDRSSLLLQLPSDQIYDWVRYPPNLYLLASMHQSVPWLDGGATHGVCLLPVATPPVGSGVRPKGPSGLSSAEIQVTLLTCRHFDPLMAWRNIPVHERQVAPLRPVRELLELLSQEGLTVDDDLIRDAYLYVGNSWASTGRGLFAGDPARNADRAFDFWLRSSALPQTSHRLRRDPHLLSRIHRFIQDLPFDPSEPLLQMLDEYGRVQGHAAGASVANFPRIHHGPGESSRV